MHVATCVTVRDTMLSTVHVVTVCWTRLETFIFRGLAHKAAKVHVHV